MNVATSIVVVSCPYPPCATDTLSTALARAFPTAHKLCRWPCIRYPVSSHSRKQLSLQLSGARPGGNEFRVQSYFRHLICCTPQGTFWYHSHFQNQYCDGLRGALVIYDPNDPHDGLYDVDDGERDVSK